jgi:hypothetical protein
MIDETPLAAEMDRRRFMQKAAITVAWATPVILTMTANSAAAATCSGPCSDHSDCNSVANCLCNGPRIGGIKQCKPH